jgi:hypothetical protein
MAEMIIQLQIDPETGKKNVIIRYSSDADALPMEHEEDHRRLVDELIEGGALSAAELGKIVVEREGAAGVQEDLGEAEQEQRRESVEQES